MMRRRGIALILTLLVTSLLVVLVGAFVAANHSNFATMGASFRQREALQAAHSGVQFCFGRLEHNQQWGKSDFTGQTLDLGTGFTVEEVATSRRIEGRLAENQTFTVRLYNNLDNDLGLTTPPVPRDSVLLQVTGRSGGFGYSAEVLYKGAPLYDAGLTANNDITLVGNKNLAVMTADPLGVHNVLRSNKNIVLGHFLENNPTENVRINRQANQPPGVIWAKGDIYHAKQDFDVGAQYEVLSGDKLSAAQQKTGGLLTPRSRSHHDIYELKPSDLVVPSANAQLDAGVYFVSSETVRYGDTTVKVRSLAIHRAGRPPEIHYDASGFAAAGIPVSNTGTGLPEGFVFPDSWGTAEQLVRHDDGVVRLGTGPAPADRPGFGPHAMMYSFGDNVFQTNPNTSVDVEGELVIFSDVPDQAPVIALTADGDGSGVIKASSHMSLMGTVQGRGSLISENGNLVVMASASVDSDSQDLGSKVVLYGDNVTMYGGKKPHLAFNGLIYAKHNLAIEGGYQLELVDGALQFVKAPESERLKSITINGAAVAQDGAITMARADAVTILYNEEYLKKFTKGMPNNRRRLEQMWWRTLMR
jgi:hypothetical protein